MKKILYYSILVAVAFFASSCAAGRGSLDTTAVYSLEKDVVTNGVLETDLEMIGEVSATIVVSRSLFRFKGNYVISEDFNFRNLKERAAFEKLKAAVLYEATKESGCDIILAPTYTISLYSVPVNHKSSSSSANEPRDVCSVTVKGFGAKIKGVRQIKTQK